MEFSSKLLRYRVFSPIEYYDDIDAFFKIFENLDCHSNLTDLVYYDKNGWKQFSELFIFEKIRLLVHDNLVYPKTNNDGSFPPTYV